MIRLLVVEDQTLFRESLSHLFAQEGDLEVAGQCSSAAEAIDALRRLQVDVLIASGRMGPEFVAAARRDGGAERIIVIADADTPEGSLAALHAGARAILSRNTSSATLARAIRVVASGGVWMDRQTVDLLTSAAPASPAPPLSGIEQRILEGIANGLTNRRIAEGLGLTEGTVKAALHRLYVKTRTGTRAQLVRQMLPAERGYSSSKPGSGAGS